jgi:hypothetical protein
MKPYAIIERRRFPLITVTFTGERETPENFEKYLHALEKNYQPKEPIALVFDASDAPIPGRPYQKLQADWMTKHQSTIKSFCLGVAYIAPNPLLRPVLRIIFSMQKNPTEFKVFANLKSGEEWAKRRLEKRYC